MNEIIQRLNSPLPPFFSKLRIWAIALGAICASVAVAPFALPASVVTIISTVAWASGAVVAVTSLTKKDGA